jgi:hypothetical protein
MKKKGSKMLAQKFRLPSTRGTTAEELLLIVLHVKEARVKITVDQAMIQC